MTAGEKPPEPERREQCEQRAQYSGLVTRLLALGVDAALLLIASVAVGFGVPALWASVEGSAPGWLKDGAQVAAGILPFLYFWLGWCVPGQTLGGLIFGITLRRTDGSPVGVLRAGVRAFFGLLLAPIWLAGMVVTVLDAKRRAAHDLLMGTVVRRM
jgi:Mce-associated membrane protein